MLRYLVLILLWLGPVLPAPGLAQGACGPGILGSPCGFGGIATAAPAEPALNLGLGNPIHLVSGNKYQRELDLPSNDSAPGLEIVRHYNSRDPRHSVLGPGWALSYDTRLHHAGGRWQIVQADGSRLAFPATPPYANSQGRIHRSGASWVWSRPGGDQLHFDERGLLTLIAPARRPALEIRRHTGPGTRHGLIVEIVQAGGHRLHLGYTTLAGRPYLAHVDTPLGRFSYDYEAMPSRADAGIPSGLWRLRTVTRPDGMVRRYHYDPSLQGGNPSHITGIDIISPESGAAAGVGSWAYDEQGRAVWWRGGPRAAELRISYVRAPRGNETGLTTVETPSGAQTRFLTASRGSRHVLLRVEGSPCPGCAAPGTRAEHDTDGRLVKLNGLTLKRHRSGGIAEIRVPDSGWPGLSLRYGPQGSRASWSSLLTGTESILTDSKGHPAARLFANGDSWHYRYDAGGRPIEIRHLQGNAGETTRLFWNGDRLARIEHPREQESREYDDHGRLRRRIVLRPGDPERVDGFDYDGEHRMVAHRLPEGGTLHYEWGTGNRLARISWEDAQGMRHAILDSSPGQPGYRYGNDLGLIVSVAQGQASELRLSHGSTPLWVQRQHYNRRGLVQHEEHRISGALSMRSWRYAYNASGQMVGAQTAGEPPLWFAWNADGSLAARRRQGRTERLPIHRDASGLPLTAGSRSLRHGPQRRLLAVRERNQVLLENTHNAFGHRISRRTPRGRTDFHYLGNRLVAESAEGSPIMRRYVYAQGVPVALIDYTDGNLYWVHADLVGAPRMVTDAQRRIRWLADYDPLGKADIVGGDLHLDLRLPGQLFDAATGWHDNLMRTYLPELGHYLEPDPLGPVPGQQALGYAGQQPRRHADPLGMLLFAFDGTRTDWSSQTNVWKMGRYYLDGAVHYQAGPGQVSQADWDAVTAYSAPLIIERQWQALLEELSLPRDPRETVPIDIIGYSRGASLARHFGNLIAQQVQDGSFSYLDPQRGLITACVDLRFMGLFDTVTQFGLLGTQNTNYDLSISAAWQWVAHAVALQERRWLFPLTVAADQGGMNVIEAPFIGAHGDVGGGLSRSEAGPPGDLSDVALNWMLWQARAAGLRFGTVADGDREVTDPILHDLRSALARTVQNGDRRINATDGALLHNYQDEHARLGRAQRDDTEQLIERFPGWRRSDSIEVGLVDMDGYARWLHDELGWQAMPA